MSDAVSYVSGDTGQPLLEQTIGQALTEAVKSYPDRTALVVRHQSIRWSFSELEQAVNRFAAGLLAMGFQAGMCGPKVGL